MICLYLHGYVCTLKGTEQGGWSQVDPSELRTSE